MKTLLLSTLAAMAMGTAALANGVVLTTALEAQTMHVGDVDMVAYRTDLGDGAYEVTAYFRARTQWAQPERVMLRLQDQDQVRFATPSEPRTLYTFVRSADEVVISAEQVPAVSVSH
ncbi:hypothetical protein RGUI_3492 [Rhodovulum sp. P5]|uniref:hypothetical protein n=1 Tax=Rhodovulum sp. P5 TaxID=1564506 RepID=UPI0009C3A122|nr:hypothetical protein [Rhodovulum sp. P5]ARE41633.1 hypothetical protein RGUI_3492 [Rhodovulum sp. P5]